MTNFLRSIQGDRPHQGDGHLEAMLSGQPLSENADPELRGVSELLATLCAAPIDRVELRGQNQALDVFRETFAGFHPTRQPRRRLTMLSSPLGARLGAALAVGAVSFGAVGAAAYTGSLPAGVQQLAHTTIGAPAPDQGDATEQGKPVDKKSADDNKATDTTTNTAVGPDATGHAAFGLCTAWAHVQTQGQVADKSVAFRNLATAAGGADKITAYCAKVPHPGASATGSSATAPGKSATHPTGKPTSHPTGSSSSHPSGSSSSHPTGSSSSHPSGKPAGTK